MSGFTLALDCERKIVNFTKNLISLWCRSEYFEQLILSLDGEEVLLFIYRQIVEPATFWEFVSLLDTEPAIVMHEQRFKLVSGQALLISSNPLFENGEIVGRTWTFCQDNFLLNED